jgi:hypothetical protein
LKPADAGNGITIPQGSLATVMLMKGQGGWSAHLLSVLVKGQPVNVSSGPASVMGSAQGAATSAASTVTSVLGGFGGFGHKQPKPNGVEAIATGNRVVLPPGTQLQFVLNGASLVAAASSGGMAGIGNPAAGSPNVMAMPHPAGAHPGTANIPTTSSTSQVAPVGNLTAKITETLLGPRTPLLS